MYKSNELVQWVGLHHGKVEFGQAFGWTLAYTHFEDWTALTFRNLDTGASWQLS